MLLTYKAKFWQRFDFFDWQQLATIRLKAIRSLVQFAMAVPRFALEASGQTWLLPRGRSRTARQWPRESLLGRFPSREMAL